MICVSDFKQISNVIPGMNAIAFTREERALPAARLRCPVRASRRMLFGAVRAAILRGAQESTRTG
jgi:hypothetical protein